MSGFDEHLRYFLTDLIENVLREILDTNAEYKELKEKSLNLSTQLQSLVSGTLLNGYLDTLCAVEGLEVNYCYLCGMRDNSSPESRNPVGEDISKELAQIEAYIQLQSKNTEHYNELHAALPPKGYALLDEYRKTRKMIIDLEKFYCYGGGMRDKKQFDKRFDSKNESEWIKFVKFFCD